MIDLGTLVGRPSANSPSSYGDVVRFQLKNQNTRPSVSQNGQDLI